MRRITDRYAPLIEPGRRARSVAVLMLAIVVSGYEALGAVLIFLLIALATDPQAELGVPVIGDLRYILPDLPSDQLVVLMAAGVAVFFLTRAVTTLGQRYFHARVANKATVDVNPRLLDRYRHMPYSFHLRRNSATHPEHPTVSLRDPHLSLHASNHAISEGVRRFVISLSSDRLWRPLDRRRSWRPRPGSSTAPSSTYAPTRSAALPGGVSSASLMSVFFMLSRSR